MQYTQSLVTRFTSSKNTEYLYNRLLLHFPHGKGAVQSYLHTNFQASIVHAADRLAHELNMSDPMPGVDIAGHLECFNNQFIAEGVEFITSHVLANEEAQAYVVHDGLPTSRRGHAHHQRKADDILKIWAASPARPCELREDCAGDVRRNPYYGQDNHNLHSGIVFCDQEHLGQQRHIDMYENTSYKIALNGNSLPHELVPFGVSTPDSDARLLGRSIFRRNEAGVENGIPRYESRLYNRHLERNIDEGLRNAEKGYMQRGYDMESLYRRVDHKRQARGRYSDGPMCPSHANHQI